MVSRFGAILEITVALVLAGALTPASRGQIARPPGARAPAGSDRSTPVGRSRVGAAVPLGGGLAPRSGGAAGAARGGSARASPGATPIAVAPRPAPGSASSTSKTGAARDFEHDMDEVHRLMESGHWQRAHEDLLRLIERHEGADYVLAQGSGIAVDLRRAAFFMEHEEPSPESLVSGDLLRWNRSNGRVKVAYTPDSTGDFVPLVPPAGWRSLALHPLDFSGPYEVDLDGPGGWSPPVLIVAMEYDEAFVVSRTYTGVFGSSRRSKTWSRVDRIVHLAAGERTVVAERAKPVDRAEGRFRCEVDVSTTRVTVRMNGGTVLRTPKRRDLFASVALAIPEGDRRSIGQPFDKLLIEGEGGSGWLAGLMDEANRDRRLAFELRYVPPLPEWMRRDPPSPPSGSRDPDLWRMHLDELWSRREFESGLELLEAAGRGTGLPEVWRAWEMARFAAASGRWMDARVHCRRVLSVRPEDVPAQVLYARLYADMGQVERALQELDVLTERHADRPEPREAAASVLLADGRPAEVRAVLDRATFDGVLNNALETLDLRLALAERGPDWNRTYETVTRHYRVVTDLDGRVAREASRVLEDALRHFATDLGLPLPELAEVFRVYVFSGVSGYRSYVHRVTGAEPRRTAGLFSPQLQQLLVWNLPNEDQMMRTLRHEAFHQFLDRLVDEAPRWLDEGMAEYYEHGKTPSGRWRSGRLPAQHRAVLRDRPEDLVPLRDFIHQDAEAFLANASLHYAQSWALVTFLRGTDKVNAARFSRLMEALSGGRSRRASLHLAFHDVEDWDAFDAAFVRFVADTGAAGG